MKYSVTSSSFMYRGKKYFRGDVIDVEEANLPGIGTRLEPYVEQKRKRRTKAEMIADGDLKVDDNEVG